MSTTFDPDAIERHGWRQGAVLGAELVRVARERAPEGITFLESDWLLVTSHDCDVANDRLDKEPIVEILRAEAIPRRSPDKQQLLGRNPRTMHLQVDDESGGTIILGLKVHERWSLPRELLAVEPPFRFLGNKERRLVAEWLAKRYIRAAFPTAFDGRWRSKMREWIELIEKHSRWIQGVYLRLNSLQELAPSASYKVDMIVAAPATAKNHAEWPTIRVNIENEVESFWKQFAGIECSGAEVIGTDQLTLAEIEPYQRFDADWVSFADGTASIPSTIDMSL